jgi:hypothetical protein
MRTSVPDYFTACLSIPYLSPLPITNLGAFCKRLFWPMLISVQLGIPGCTSLLYSRAKQ